MGRLLRPQSSRNPRLPYAQTCTGNRSPRIRLLIAGLLVRVQARQPASQITAGLILRGSSGSTASLRDDIRAGRLKPGDQLPTVAELAVAHTVAVGT
ncbi:MAG: GntR family transcriptional regulator, partial [Pseudonocardiaceae bacterium]